MTILEMCLEKLFDKNEEMVRLVYCPGRQSLIWSRRVWRGTLVGYPIPQYRTKNWQIQKYHVKNGRNTDTAFMIGDAYLTLYPSRVFFFFISSVYPPEINLSLREKT